MKTRVLWLLLLATILVIFVDIISKILNIDINNNQLFFLISMGLPILSSLLHSSWTLSFPRAVCFMMFAFIVGLLAEIQGLQNGTIFGGHYIYNGGTIMIENVPIFVPFYWAVFIYTGYTIVNSFLVWMNKEKPSITNKSLYLLPLLIILDGIIVVTIDMFMDPIEVQKGTWTWLEGGPYFGVPIGNFIGWFIVTIVITTIFRILEYVKPLKVKIDHSVFLIPVIGYGMLSLSFFSSALKFNMIPLAIIGISLMMTISLINLALFTHQKMKRVI